MLKGGFTKPCPLHIAIALKYKHDALNAYYDMCAFDSLVHYLITYRKLGHLVKMS